MANQKKRLDDFFTSESKETEELTEYIDTLNEGVDPNKTTFADRLANFFKNLAQKAGVYYGKEKKKSDKPTSLFREKFGDLYHQVMQKFADRFNFEAGVDILDDVSVLYRRNKVNKNIMWVINIVFIIFTFIGNQHPNYVIIAGFAVIMFAINTTLKRIIDEQPRTLVKQQMAMYIGSIYILLASFGVYIKLRVSAGNLAIFDLISNDSVSGLVQESMILSYMTDISISQAGYILIYFALVVIALYQDATLLRILFKWVFVLMIVTHIFILYPLYKYAGDLYQLGQYLFVTNTNVTIDILLRTLVLVVFYIALYSSVSIGQMMNNKRKQELIKRREMESDFKAVVGDVFDVINVFNQHTINQNEECVTRIAEIASRLGRVLGLNNQICKEIYEYSVVHIDKVKDLNIFEYEKKQTLTEQDYEDIREKTILGSVIIKRLQLNQKSEEIVRAHFEKTVDSHFTEKMKRIQRSQEGQIILLAEIYDIMRQERNYKKELRHKRAVDLLQLEFKEYFEPYILDRFMRYQLEFEKIYDKFVEKEER